MHAQPQTSRPPLTLLEARTFERHHLVKLEEAIMACDSRMARFHQMRADYLRAAIATGFAKDTQ